MVKLFVLVVALSVPVGATPRYAFYENSTGWGVPRFLTKKDCEQAATDMIEPLTRAGYSVSARCEEER